MTVGISKTRVAGLAIDYEYLNAFCQRVVEADGSIRWAGVVNKNGVIIAQHKRPGLQLLLTDEENEEYASTAIARQKTRGRFESKIGRMLYAFGRYERLHRATIPINDNNYLLITLDVEQKNFDSVIMAKVVPLIHKNQSRFATLDDSI